MPFKFLFSYSRGKDVNLIKASQLKYISLPELICSVFSCLLILGQWEKHDANL